MYIFVNWLLETFFLANKLNCYGSLSFFHVNHFKGAVEHKQWCDYRRIFFVSRFALMVALRARVSCFALCHANPLSALLIGGKEKNLQLTLHPSQGQQNLFSMRLSTSLSSLVSFSEFRACLAENNTAQ